MGLGFRCAAGYYPILQFLNCTLVVVQLCSSLNPSLLVRGSDIDLESEACRCFGAARFDIYAALRLTSLRRYRGALKHRMAPTDPWTVVEGQFLTVWGTNVAW